MKDETKGCAATRLPLPHQISGTSPSRANTYSTIHLKLTTLSAISIRNYHRLSSPRPPLPPSPPLLLLLLRPLPPVRHPLPLHPRQAPPKIWTLTPFPGKWEENETRIP